MRLYILFHHVFLCLCIQAFALFHHILHVYVSTFFCTISPCIFNRARYVSILECYFTMHFVCLCIHVFTLFHHILLCLCVQVTYTISPYDYVFMCPCFCTISPYILIIYVMYPYYLHYFTT